MDRIQTENAPPPGGSFSQARVSGSLVAVAGQVGIDPATGLLADGLVSQVAQSIRNLAAVLEEAGAGLESVMKTTCFLTDIEGFDDFDKAYRVLFAEPYPARSTVEVGLKAPLLFEIEAWAVLPQG